MIAYESAFVVVHHATAEEVLPGLQTESFDLIATDPPYGVEWQSNTRAVAFDKIANDGAADRGGVAAVLRECVRLVGQNRHLYIFGPTDVLDGLKVSAVVQLVWDKCTLGSGDMTSAWGPAHESINFMVSKHRHAGKTGVASVPARLRKGSVLSFPRPTGRQVRHPSEKPVPLMRELIESSTRSGDTVLDPYAGTGSTGVAAILSGRKAVLVESHRPYVDLLIERVKTAESIAMMAWSA